MSETNRLQEPMATPGHGLTPVGTFVSISLILGAAFFIKCTMLAMDPAFAMMQSALAISADKAFFLRKVSTMAFAVSVVCGGFIPAGRTGRGFAITSLVLLSASVTSSGFCTSYQSLLIARTATAVCCGLMTPFLVVTALNIMPRRFWNTWIAAWLITGMLGGAVAYLFAGRILQLHGSHPWRFVFWFIGPPGFVLSLLFLFLKLPRTVTHSSLTLNADDFTGYFRSRPFLFVAISGMLAVFCANVLRLGGVAYLMKQMQGASPDHMFPIVGVSVLVLFIATVTGGVLPDALCKKNPHGIVHVIAGSLLIASLVFCYFLLFEYAFFFFLFLFFAGIFQVPLTVLVMSLARAGDRFATYGIFAGLVAFAENISWILKSSPINSKVSLLIVTVLMFVSGAGFILARIKSMTDDLNLLKK